MKKITVLCSLPMDPAGVAMIEPVADVRVASAQTDAALYAEIGDADILLVRSQLPPDLFDRPNRLAGVIRQGTGLDLIPVDSATAHGIPVANVPGANVQAVVEYCIASFLAFARQQAQMNTALHASGWAAARKLSTVTSELAGKTLGIVGPGNIGAGLARACKAAFGMRTIGHHPDPKRVPGDIEAVSLDELFSQSDYISLNCPLNQSTRHLVNAARLRQMKPSAVLVNAARGAVVDEQALAEALRERRIAGAAVDVFAEQPLSRDHPFLGLDNMVLTPHVAALTRESSEKMGVGAAKQILQLLRGEKPQYLVNPAAWERRRRLDTQEGERA